MKRKVNMRNVYKVPIDITLSDNEITELLTRYAKEETYYGVQVSYIPGSHWEIRSKDNDPEVSWIIVVRLANILVFTSESNFSDPNDFDWR